ncbi:AraC-like DNA-binding protein [Microbacterium natoriense]|uniref:AraC-like DNA-binding protein n=1 Tax=Microbacterium natoriense TaxID=284570 RepID=A0AAW8EWT1_9MICO|nr:AraC-like DNA-binding protein [Microbacterium natoriense]
MAATHPINSKLAKPYLIGLSESVIVLPVPVAASNRLAEPVLHCCLRGSAQILVEEIAYAIVEGEGLWVSAGSRVHVSLGRRDVVVPVPGVTVSEAAGAFMVVLPQSWQPWILHAFGEALGHLEGGVSRACLQAELDAVGPRGGVLNEPRFPTSEDLIGVAAALKASPAISISGVVGAGAGWSSRTLRRRFVTETGQTPQQWARTHRMMLAADLLSAGHEVATVAQLSGYCTASGFARRFRAHTGVTPGAWHRRQGAGNGSIRLGAPPAASLVPADRTWLRVNGVHVAVWVARGAAVVKIGERQQRMIAGQAMVLPAGTPNSIQLFPGSLLLPVGYRPVRSKRTGAPIIPVVIDHDDVLDLVHAMVSAYTTVHPYASDSHAGFDRVWRLSTSEEPLGDDVCLSVLAGAISTGEVQTSLAECAHWAGLRERELSRIVNERAGMSFARWIRAVRMSSARAQLHRGVSASTVSRQLGYAHLPAFSRAFRQTHGLTPQSVLASTPPRSEAGRWYRASMRHSGFGRSD